MNCSKKILEKKVISIVFRIIVALKHISNAIDVLQPRPKSTYGVVLLVLSSSTKLDNAAAASEITENSFEESLTDTPGQST